MNFICPQCSHPLQENRSEWACSACDTVYPQVDGIPWLVPQPGAQLAEWRLKLQAWVSHMDGEIETFKAELRRPDLGTLTQKRLRKMLQAKVEHKKYLTEIMAPLDRQGALSTEMLKATGIQIPSGQTLTSYYVNIHRDWSWETAENQASLDVIKHLLGSHANLGHLLVLGSGACRLPYDVHQTYKPKRTIATDINPFMLLAARRILRGKNVKLYEFPIAPKDLESYAVLRKCIAPALPDETFQLLFADAFKPPFEPHSFDTVMTPWLIDILPFDVSLIIQSVNRLLKPGGVWINFGSLAFNHASHALNYSLEETLELIQKHGFLLADVQRDRIPYMQSPASHHARLETVVSFAASKQKDVDSPRLTSYLPDWLRDPTRPIPALQAFQASRVIHGIYIEVLSLVDQKRSLAEIAQIFGGRHQMDPTEAEASLRNFFSKLWEESHAGQNF